MGPSPERPAAGSEDEVIASVETSAAGGAEVADVARITDPDAVAEGMERDGEALVTITVTLGVDGDRVGTVILSLRLEV